MNLVSTARSLLIVSLLAGCAGMASGNVLLNPGFELGTDTDASDWLQVAGPSGSSIRDGGMPNSGSFSAYMQVDHINNPAAPTPYSFEQMPEAGAIDHALNYDLSFSAKVDSENFDGFDMFYQVIWLDLDGSDGGGVKGEFLNQLISAGINTSYQSFGVSDIDVPDGADSLILRFQLSPGAVDGIANGLYIDDVSLATDAAGSPGDFNNDGDVDAVDYALWRDNLGGSFDLNGNGDETGGSAGVVDTADYTLWRSNFDGTPIGPSRLVSATPEPSTLLLLLGSMPLAALSAKRQR